MVFVKSRKVNCELAQKENGAHFPARGAPCPWSPRSTSSTCRTRPPCSWARARRPRRCPCTTRRSRCRPRGQKHPIIARARSAIGRVSGSLACPWLARALSRPPRAHNAWSAAPLQPRRCPLRPACRRAAPAPFWDSFTPRAGVERSAAVHYPPWTTAAHSPWW